MRSKRKQLSNSLLYTVNMHFTNKYLVCNINSPIHFHQFTKEILAKFGVMIFLMMQWNAFWGLLEIYKRMNWWIDAPMYTIVTYVDHRSKNPITYEYTITLHKFQHIQIFKNKAIFNKSTIFHEHYCTITQFFKDV